VLRPYERHSSRQNTIVRVASCSTINTVADSRRSSSTPLQVSIDDNEDVTLPTPESDSEHMVIDQIPPTAPLSQDNDLKSVVPVVSLDERFLDQAETSVGETNPAREQDPTPRLRKRTTRVSYAVEATSGNSGVEEHASDTYSFLASEAESNFDGASSTRSLTPSIDESSMTEGGQEEDEVKPVIRLVKPTKSSAVGKSSSNGRGVDTSLPPLDNIDDCFADMVAKASKLGLEKAVLNLVTGKRDLNVATMCSGTEAPLVALDLINKALMQEGKPPISINHLFSAEIDTIKQGYIERNFSPPRMFRDIREMIPENATTATTAYGAEESIPGNVDLLIAGFVCKDLSRLNNHQKGLDDEGESGDTWKAIYSYAKRFRPTIILIENVSATKGFWNGFQTKWSAIDYEYTWMICDTKNYYLPQTRQRMYMIAIDKKQYGKGVKDALRQWETVMETLQRRCSSPFEAFLTSDTPGQYQHISLVTDPNWALCRLRYDHIRTNERLGIHHPMTYWSDNGTVRPPDIASLAFFLSMSSRVWECIEIANLQCALKGYDSLYKMLVWDVSQSVDRYKALPGIVSCITPNGTNFISNRHNILTGSQALLLQGMPAEKLVFANETQKELQDLAGNAMTTTVIGASLIAALVTGSSAFRNVKPHQTYRPNGILSQTPELVMVEPVLRQTLLPANSDELSPLLNELIKESLLSSRLCNCEEINRISNSDVKSCLNCGHTACSTCAGNPTHSYSAKSTPTVQRLSPNEFEKKWRPMFPSRLRFSTFIIPQGLKSKAENYLQAYTNRIQQAKIPSIFFSISGFKRCDRSWSVRYESSEATLELVLAANMQWRLTMKCPKSEPGNSLLRKMLAQPLARGLVTTNLLKPKWQIYVPKSSTHLMSISGSGARTKAWRSRLGLPDYKNETVPLQLQVESSSSPEIERLAGQYDHMPLCGTAKNSLYKKTATADNNPIYLFHDQDPIGPHEKDSFIFSHSCERLPYGEARFSLGSLEPSWQPWAVKSGSLSHVNVTIPGKWKNADISLKAAPYAIEASVPTATALSTASSGRCSDALVVLDATANVAADTGRYEQFGWVLERAKSLPSYNSWQPFDATCPKNECICAPSDPRILWNVNEKGEATAYEDRKAAAVFERTLKTRCDIFHVKALQQSTGMHVQIGLNIASLAHRARSRLSTADSISFRLLTNHVEPAREKFPKFRLQSNASDKAYAGRLKLRYELGDAQLKSLSWMRAQEFGKRLALTEVEEAIHPNLGWRLEAKAEHAVTVRGGVLADLPSFGKTVTTIALISSEFESVSTETLLEQNRQTVTGSSLIPVVATLVVSPPHIAKQWYSEFESCLKKDNTYNILLIESFSDLKRLSIQDLEDSKVIIVSWNVLADEAYISQLALFSAMPLPASTRGRAYDAWLDFCSAEVQHQVETSHKLSASDFIQHTHSLLDKRLAHPDFKAIVPVKIAHGSSYQSFNALQAVKAKNSSIGKSSSSARINNLSVPLLQMFNFNRIVVDEYHYLYNSRNSDNQPACAAIKRISATKRWVLSGTPSLANFSDVSQIASFLGIGLKLGRDVYGDGTVTTALEKKLTAEQTDVERFISRTETMSYQWHQARHERAQAFLDDFLRQNEPSLQHIICQEALHTVELDIAHRAVYIELAQHLISQRMQIKKLKGKIGSDRSDRLNASLNNSATAEEALLKAALHFITKPGDSGLDSHIKTRRQQRMQVEDQISLLLQELKATCLRMLNDPAEDYFLAFQHDIESGHILEDDSVRTKVRRLITKVDKAPTTRTKKRGAPKDIRALKELASEVCNDSKPYSSYADSSRSGH
jgi:site-specific DNA-cytosine methylase